MASLLAKTYLAEAPLPGELASKSAKTDEDLVALQRLAAAPRRYHFLIRKVEPKPRKP
jgi:hypothetical protein